MTVLVIMDSAMGQIPRFTERISSFEKLQFNECKPKIMQTGEIVLNTGQMNAVALLHLVHKKLID